MRGDLLSTQTLTGGQLVVETLGAVGAETVGQGRGVGSPRAAVWKVDPNTLSLA
jgi:hypothetical protein